MRVAAFAAVVALVLAPAGGSGSAENVWTRCGCKDAVLDRSGSLRQPTQPLYLGGSSVLDVRLPVAASVQIPLNVKIPQRGDNRFARFTEVMTRETTT